MKYKYEVEIVTVATFVVAVEIEADNADTAGDAAGDKAMEQFFAYTKRSEASDDAIRIAASDIKDYFVYPKGSD